MRACGWGRYPSIDAQISRPTTAAAAAALLRGADAVTPRGLARSYGDSALGPHIVDATGLDCMFEFDAQSGRLRCGAGVSLGTILDVFLPRGWSLPVTPGTRHVTIGGALASDVHGKNHHLDGCFSAHVDTFALLLASGDIVTCTRNTNAALFHATCGGMGLTGLIVEATLTLRRVTSAYTAQTRSSCSQRRAPRGTALRGSIASPEASRWGVRWSRRATMSSKPDWMSGRRRALQCRSISRHLR